MRASETRRERQVMWLRVGKERASRKQTRACPACPSAPSPIVAPTLVGSLIHVIDSDRRRIRPLLLLWRAPVRHRDGRATRPVRQCQSCRLRRLGRP